MKISLNQIWRSLFRSSPITLPSPASQSSIDRRVTFLYDKFKKEHHTACSEKEFYEYVQDWPDWYHEKD